MPIERKLAAIMFTDIAGYTAQMSKSESKSLNLLEKKRSILNPLIKEYNGTFVKEIGDGTLSYFESAVNAATCAVKLQEQTYDDSDMNIRAGIHIGDIVFKDGDVFGDGVNVASRLESIAPQGGVCVSKSVYDELLNQEEFDGVELGLQSLKGVGRLIEVFGLKGDKLKQPNPKEYQDNKIKVHSDDEVPSIAIIPFENKGADEDSFYAYSISADLIIDISRAGMLRVSSMKKIQNLDKLSIPEIADKLNVRYVATGGLWKLNNIFQLSVELYDTKDEKIIWIDRWEENWNNLSNIKDILTDGLLKGLNIKSKFKTNIVTDNAEAYEYYLRGVQATLNSKSWKDIEIAIGLYKKSLKLDKMSIQTYWRLGWCYEVSESGDRKKNIDKAISIWQKGIAIGKKNNLKNYYRLYTDLAIIMHKSVNDSQKSYKYLMKADKHLKNNNDIKGHLSNQNMLNIYYSDMGDYEKSISCIKKVSKYEKILKKNSWLSEGHLANQYHHMGLFDKAEKMYIQHIKQTRSGVDGWNVSKLVNLYIDIKNYKKAKDAILSYRSKKKYKRNKETNIRKMSTHIFSYEVAKVFVNMKLGLDVKLEKQKLLETYELREENNFVDIELSPRYYYYLYQIFNNTSYLEHSFLYINKKANNLEPIIRKKFLNYPMPKAIVEEYNKVFKK